MKNKLHVLVRLALLVALEVLLSRFFSISTWNVKIGFAFVPLALAGMLYGPAAGLVTGALADFIGAILFPIGPYFPGFTLTNALKGGLYGLCLGNGRGADWKAISLAVVGGAVVLSLGLNTLWIHILYGAPIPTLLATRLFQELIVVPVQIVVLRAVGAPRIQRVLA